MLLLGLLTFLISISETGAINGETLYLEEIIIIVPGLHIFPTNPP